MSEIVYALALSILPIFAFIWTGYERGYRKGQIDALTGVIRYKLIEKPNGSRVWKWVTEVKSNAREKSNKGKVTASNDSSMHTMPGCFQYIPGKDMSGTATPPLNSSCQEGLGGDMSGTADPGRYLSRNR